MNLRVVILPAKQLANGTHKIRIAISHRGETRYIVTRFVVPSTDNLRNGSVVNVNNASYINQQLRIRMNNIYNICDREPNIEYFSCAQLMSFIDAKESRIAPKTFHEIAEKFLASKRMSVAEATVKLYEDCIRKFETFFGEDYLLQLLTSDDLHKYRKWLTDKCKLKQTTISIREKDLHTIINYAVRLKYVTYEISPYISFSDCKPTVRQCTLTIEELRAIRDLDFSKKPRDKMKGFARDVLMLSFYLCGMNLTDMLAVDLSKEYVSYARKKTRNNRKTLQNTEFTIQPEARALIDRLFVDGKLSIKHERSYNAVSRILRDNLPKIAKAVGIEGKKLVYYSARKTFAQLANELFIKDSVIEYCIGDTVTQSTKVIGFYIQVNKRMADKSIRKVFDAVASDKTIEQLTEDAI